MTDVFTPTPFRYRWTVTRDIPSPTTVAEGRAFRAVRVRYGLTLREVAQGWGISDVEAGELERGIRRFTTPADLSAALSQLWLWAMEKSKGDAAKAREEGRKRLDEESTIRTPLGPRVRKPNPHYTPPRSKPVDAAKEAEATLAPEACECCGDAAMAQAIHGHRVCVACAGI